MVITKPWSCRVKLDVPLAIILEEGQNTVSPVLTINVVCPRFIDYFDEFAEEADVNAPFAHPCHRWENGFHTTAREADCSPASTGLVILHGERRMPVIDRERGIAVAFVHFARNLPDMHMFKFRSGHIELIQSVIGKGGAGTMGWGDDPTLSRREAAENEQMSAPLDPEEAN